MSEPWDSVLREEEAYTKELQRNFLKNLGTALAVIFFLIFLIVVIMVLVSGTPAQEQPVWKKEQNRMLYGPGSCLTIQEHKVYCARQ